MNLHITPADIAEIEALVQSARERRRLQWDAMVADLTRTEQLYGPHVGAPDVEFRVPDDAELLAHVHGELWEARNRIWLEQWRVRELRGKLLVAWATACAFGAVAVAALLWRMQ